MIGYLYIAGTIIFTVIGQLLVKYGIPKFGAPPSSFKEVIPYFFKAITNIYFISGIGLAFIASLCWILALSKFQLSFAYPFMSLSFVLVFILSYFIFGESVNLFRVLGILVIIIGVFLVSKS